MVQAGRHNHEGIGEGFHETRAEGGRHRSRKEYLSSRRYGRTRQDHFTEACGGAHYGARHLREQGHEVKLMAPQYVKPYVKTNKNALRDAEAIAEAVTRPSMRFMPIKNVEQQDLQALHRV